MKVKTAAIKGVFGALALVTVLALVVFTGPRLTRWPSIEEVQQTADKNGFSTHLRSHREHAGGDFVMQKLIVSKTPLSKEDAEALNLSVLEHPSWRGRACVLWTNMPEMKLMNPVPNEMVGDLRLFGDRDVIKAIKEIIERR
jgi:hypothetical protein